MDEEMELLNQLGENALAAKYELQKLSTDAKNQALITVAHALVRESGQIIQENERILREAKKRECIPV